jgi:hypothetical protein
MSHRYLASVLLAAATALTTLVPRAALAGDFTLTIDPVARICGQGPGDMPMWTITIGDADPDDPFTGVVTFTAPDDFPPGTTHSFNPNPVSVPDQGNTTVFTVVIGDTTPSGNYDIIVTGTDDHDPQDVHTVTAKVHVCNDTCVVCHP